MDLTGNDFFNKITRATLERSAAIGLKHALANRPFIKKTIKDISKDVPDLIRRPALVVSGGPSLHKNAHLKVLKEEGFPGPLVAADCAIGHCLRHGIVPEFVLTVDPHPHRIIRWFGDTKIHERPEDDYFQHQDIDPELNANEIAKNEELISLVNQHGSRIKLAISTSTSPEITERALSAGIELYWWNPLYDDFDHPGSVSATLRKEVNIPFMTTGGNVGACCWAFAQAILKSDPVYMVGMDFGYPPGTKVQNTQYYDVLKDIYPDNPARGLIEVPNHILGETWLTDPAYYWYKLCFLKMNVGASGRTINCTEGGILFDYTLEWMPFRTALKGLKL